MLLLTLLFSQITFLLKGFGKRLTKDAYSHPTPPHPRGGSVLSGVWVLSLLTLLPAEAVMESDGVVAASLSVHTTGSLLVCCEKEPQWMQLELCMKW